MAIFNQPLENIFKEFNSSPTGLSSSLVKLNLEKYGENKISNVKKKSLLSRFFAQFKNIMIVVLLFSAIISTIIALLTKEYNDLFEGGLIFVIVIINAIIGVIQEKKASEALELLNKKTQPFSKVIRNNSVSIIHSEDIVVGDIVLLKAGDFIPADIRIIESRNFKCNESSLTGESQDVIKLDNIFLKEETPIAEQQNMCFSGTCCTCGNAKGIVVNVGKNTEIGKISSLLHINIKEKTPLEKNIDKIGKIITFGVLGITLIVFLVGLIFSQNASFMDIFLTSIALAVAAIPESLPTVITIVMALGVERLAKQKAIVKNLSAVETLGCCNVICTDKTGTLTQNKMIVKHVYINQKIITDFSKLEHLDKLVECALLCNNTQIDNNKQLVGDATETALFKFGMNFNGFNNIIKSYPRIHENPFDSSRKLMSTINKTPSGNIMFCKGAFDYLIKKCSHFLLNNQKQKLNESYKQEINKTVSTFCSSGERVIALAYKPIENETNTNEENLIFIGLIGISDPPKPETYNAILECKKAGLSTVMITGDHPETALSIAKELKIANNLNEVITGTQLDKLKTNELAKIINNYKVFARVTPKHKVKIVKAFKKSGKIVSMTGDGVNDAPSLSYADIGTCMGKTGTDVAKSASDIIITDDNFSTIVVSIKQGRTIYSNIQKIIQFLISTNAVEVLGIFVATIILKDCIFLLPSQILFINLVTDSFPAFALGMEKPEKSIMSKPPRNPNESLFSGKIGTGILYQSFVQTLIVLIVFVYAVNKFNNKIASTMIFLIICLMQIIHAINCKTTESIFKINIFNNPSFNISFIGLFILILTVAFVPFLQNMFGIVPLDGIQWLIVSLCSMSIIPLVEICKLFVNLYYKNKS